MPTPISPARRNRALVLTRRPTRWSVLVPLVGVLAGVMLTVSSVAARGTDLRGDATGLPELIRERQLANARRIAQIERLQAQVDAAAAAAAPANAELTGLTATVERLGEVVGTVPVHGPTVTVALNDSALTSEELPDWANVNDIVVHQQDVQAVVNALWRGGAEAMTIMDQRVIATSAVRCVGNTLILRGRVYSPPFVISAIGDPDALEAALAGDPQIQRYQEYVAALGLGYAVERTGEKTFPGYAATLDNTYARAVR